MRFKGVFVSTAVVAAFSMSSAASAALIVDDFSEDVPLSVLVSGSPPIQTNLADGLGTRSISASSPHAGFWGVVRTLPDQKLEFASGAVPVTFSIVYDFASNLNLSGLTGIDVLFDMVQPGFESTLDFKISMTDDGSLGAAFESSAAASAASQKVQTPFDPAGFDAGFNLSAVSQLVLEFNLDAFQAVDFVLAADPANGGGGVIVVPEPASLALMAAGCFIMGYRRR